MLSVEQIKALPILTPPITVRVKFTKTGSLKYISHLDLQRTLTRCLIRSRLPVWYTKGFNPHTKLVFSLPLSVGCESVCEFVDLRFERDIPLEEIKEMLSYQFTDEMLVLDVYYPQSKFSELSFAEYECVIHSRSAKEEHAKEIENFLSTSPVNMMKRTKSGEKEIDIVPFIKKAECKYEGGALFLSLLLCANEGSNLNPEYPIRAINEKFSLLTSETEDYYSLMRKNVLRADLTEFK